MLQNKQNIVLYIVAGLLVYLVFTTNGIKTDIKSYKDKIELIQTKVDSAQTVNKQIDTKIDSVKENVISITKEIHHIDNTITIVKNQTNEKINTVDKFSNTELEFFFTNRYNKSYSAN
jgi:chromosome segregation ATPase